MRPKLERSQVVFDFLNIMRRTPAAPSPLRPLQHLFIRASVEILPPWARDILGLGRGYGLRPWERRLVALAGTSAEHVVLKSAPPAQACQRMGLPASYLYRRR
ncbi:MAG: oxygenase MpaB family protein [Pseudomonadota bacterium]